MTEDSLSKRYREIRSKIPDGITLIAVSKNQSIDAIEAVYQLGQRDFGENYVQELKEKAIELEKRGCTGIRWHFIGHLQTNKVKLLLPFVYAVHSVDSERLASELAKRWIQLNRHVNHCGPLPVFIEVNIDKEESKTGIMPDHILGLAETLKELRTLKLLGLMCVPAEGQDPRPRFALLRELGLKCRPFSEGKLSMGMSNDYPIAIQEGATHIRVGTALFGQRQNRIVKPQKIV